MQVKAQDLPVAGGVHAGGHHAGDGGDPAVLADLLGERIEPDVRVGSAVQRPAAEVLHRLIELLGHLRDARLGDPLDPEVTHQALDSPRRDAPDVGLAEDRKSTRLNSSHGSISYAVVCLKKKKIVT